ncbi:MAG: bifunctional oligoribonuclease/PAP phosphatase NrnA [Bacteroidales bacterium]|nr:bifunctional oligoribonuclease/PAP phosphatase NrnA [Bacteroidales bacterium]
MIQIEINQSSIEKIQKLVSENQTFVITSHHNSDGDAVGSSTAVAEVLRKMGKEVKIILPNDYPSFFRWMVGAGDILTFDRHRKEALAFLDKADVLICLDFNQYGRVDELEPVLINWNKKCIVIDHHLGLQIQADAIVSVPEASSTCELVYRVLTLCGFDSFITKVVAESIYAGIMTDTGRLDYASSYAGVYEVVGKLIEKGVNKVYVHDKIYNVYTYSRLCLQATILKENMVYLPEYHAVYLTISLKNQKDFSFQLGDSEGFVNIPLAMRDVKFCAMFTEYENGLVKVSLRSKRDFPASDFASQFYSGGGHFNAAGGKFQGTLQDAVKVFREGLEVYKEKLQK